MNDILSICIPTYNRSEFLAYNIEKMLPYIRKYNIPIYLSDNNSKDNTISVIKNFQKEYKYIFFVKNKENIGADRNFEQVLKMSVSKYSWLLSDDDQINCAYIEKILSILNGSYNYDMIIVNGGKRVKGIKEKIYEDKNELLSEIGWHMTWMSCLIFSNEIIRKANWEKYNTTYLSQFAIIFDFFAQRDSVKVYWVDQEIITAITDVPFKRDRGWSSRTFEIFSCNWYKIINEYPDSYSKLAKINCIKSHGEKSKLFTLKSMIMLRYHNILNYNVLKKYKKPIKMTVNISYVLLIIISIIPLSFFYQLKFIKDFFCRLKNTNIKVMTWK